MIFADKRSRHHLLKEFFYRAPRVPYGIDHFADAKTVLDIGANCGLFCLCSLFHVPKARVVAIEPDPKTFHCLTANLANLPVECHQLALGRPATAAVVSQATSHRNSLVRHYGAAGDGGGRAIPACSLCGLVERFGIETSGLFVKMDTEGAEHEVFASPTDMDVLAGCLGFAIEIHLQLRSLPPILARFTDTHDVIYDETYRWKSRNICYRRRG
jgi:FkbM family methyltransferase